MSLVEQVQRLQESFNTIAEMVSVDAKDLIEVIKAIKMKLDLLRVYEEAMRQNINPIEAAEMHDLAKTLMGRELFTRSSRLRAAEEEISQCENPNYPARVVAEMPKESNKPVRGEEQHRERIRQAWQRSEEREDQVIIDIPFEEYAEEFTDYLASELAKLQEERE